MSDIIEKINKALKKDVAFTGKTKRDKVESLSTGLLSLDYALGVGGLPKGRIIDLNGLPSVGKSSLCLHMIAVAQQQGIKCAFIDAEYSFVTKHAQIFGVATDELVVVQPDSGEEAFETLELLLNEGYGFIVIDSVSALSPRSEIEAEIGKPTMGGQARLISQGLRRVNGLISKNKAVVLFINQLRKNIMGGPFNQYTVSGGMALHFYTSIRMELKREGKLELGPKHVGNKIKIKITKNKVAEPDKTCYIEHMFGDGFTDDANILEIATDAGIVIRQGNSYMYEDTKLGTGKEKSSEFIESNPDIKNQILSRLNAPSEQ